LAESIDTDVATLPYEEGVLSRIREAQAQGHPVYLASASDERLVSAVANHLDIFDGWFASDGATNLAGNAKATRLVEVFGEENFDYIGNRPTDLPVWKRAATAIAVDPSRRLERQLSGFEKSVERIATAKPRRAWLTLLRPHQWTKNVLVGVPLLTAHQFTATAAMFALFAAIAFSCCASAVYVLNDLVDIQADRGHPSKRKRPFASGDVPFATGAISGTMCLILAVAIAGAISLQFLAVLIVYLVTTIGYSLILKRKMLIDVVTLAGLYTVRVLAGAVAIRVPMSEWLLTFSIFIFLYLALIKRYSELAIRFDMGLSNPTNRNYKNDDLPVVLSLAAASGYCAVIVLTLYLSSDTVRALYAHPLILWLAVPLLIYWISRVLMLSHRRFLQDDPTVFAIRDRVTWATAALIIILGFLAAWRDLPLGDLVRL
jgi:4-hydroxybenzoate polyprenyltransferase